MGKCHSTSKSPLANRTASRRTSNAAGAARDTQAQPAASSQHNTKEPMRFMGLRGKPIVNSHRITLPAPGKPEPSKVAAEPASCCEYNLLPNRVATSASTPVAPDENVFTVRDLSKVYGSGPSEVRALCGVDLELKAGELVVLLGASGSGKSTLLNILGGLDSPSEGELRFRGWDLGRADEAGLTRYRRDVVGFVFQFYNLIPSLTARENVGLITEIARAPMAPADALGLVGLSPRADHFPSQLSGGEQQRVAIARAIAKRPEVLLCDEPTGALDIKTGIAVLDAIQRVNRELGTLAVIITHNAVIADMADRVLTLCDGRIQNIKTNVRRRPVGELDW